MAVPATAEWEGGDNPLIASSFEAFNQMHIR